MSLPLFNDGTEDIPQKEEEGGFFELNNTANPADLGPGALAKAVNCWMELDGKLNTRPGRRLVADVETTTAAKVNAMAYFDSPTREAVIIASGTGLHEITADVAPQTPAVVAAGVLPATGKKEFAQLVDRMFVAKETAGLVWVFWNGSVWANGTTTQFSNSAAMPVFSAIAAHRFRMFAVEKGTNKIYASKILSAHLSGPGGDWSQFDNIVVGTGSGDPTRAILSGQQSDIVVINEGSVWSVDTSAVTVADWVITKLTDLAGCVAGATAIMVGQDVFFLSRYGLVSLSGLVTRDTISAASTISAPVNNTIERINWAAVDGQYGARCTLWKNLLLLAVPIDGAEQANHILAYNTLTRKWVGEWTAPEDADLETWGVSCLTRFGGIQETLIAEPDGGAIYRLDREYTKDDNRAGVPTDINAWAKTRALWFAQHEAIKMPFWLEVEFHRSSSTKLTVIFVPDDEKTYPEATLEASRVIQADFSGSNFPTFPFTLPLTFISKYTKRVPWHIRAQPRFREGQIIVHSKAGQIGLRKLKIAAWLDTPKLT